MALEKIINQKRQECLKIRDKAEGVRPSLKPSKRSLVNALRPQETPYGGRSFILECKKASPSRGLIREDFNLEAILKAYRPFASAISVLTDHTFFQGDFEFLRIAAKAVTQPILCKDFILEPAQIQWARHHGADAVLLMLSVLDDATYRELKSEADRWNMDVLTEVHDAEECERTIHLGAPIIGINNRNLKNLAIDLATTKQLANLIPPDRVLLSESGFFHHHEVREHRKLVDGFLVGSSLMQEQNLDLAVRKLIFGRVKVCGLTRPEDAQLAWNHGASYGGMILGANSPRQIGIELASKIVKSAPLKFVGIFQNRPTSEVATVSRSLGLHAVQLHGEESADDIKKLRRHLPPETQIWRARSIEWEESIPDLAPLAPINRELIDRRAGNQSGGTGLPLNWSSLLEKANRGEAILAGGLAPSNAAQADQLDMWGLDVSSGLEDRPGIKSESKVRLFFENLRGGSM